MPLLEEYYTLNIQLMELGRKATFFRKFSRFFYSPIHTVFF